MMVWWSAASWAVTCVEPVSLAQVSATLDEAERAYLDLDPAKVAQAVDRIGLQLPCVAHVVPPELSVRTHRIYALLAWGEGREVDARSSLSAMRRVDPEATLPEELVPPGHALHAALAEAQPTGFAALAQPRRGELRFDGAVGDARPGDPTIAQYVVDEQVDWTARVTASMPLPAYPARPLPTGRNVAWKPWVATGTGIASAAMYGAAWASRLSFDGYQPEPGQTGDEAYDTLARKRSTVTGLTFGAAVGALATLAVVVVPL